MNTRAWLVIVFLGVGSVGAMGMVAKFAFEADPQLKELVVFKRAMAEAFSGRGVDEISLRRDKSRRGYEVFLTCELPTEDDDRERVDHEVADYFVRKHRDVRADKLKILYLPKSSWGCSSRYEDPIRVKEVQLRPIRVRIKRDQREQRLTEKLNQEPGVKVLSTEWSKDRRLRFDFAVAKDDPKALDTLGKKIEKDIRVQLRGFYSKLQLRFFRPAAKAPQKRPTRPGEEPANLIHEIHYSARGIRERGSR